MKSQSGNALVILIGAMVILGLGVVLWKIVHPIIMVVYLLSPLIIWKIKKHDSHPISEGMSVYDNVVQDMTQRGKSKNPQQDAKIGLGILFGICLIFILSTFLVLLSYAKDSQYQVYPINYLGVVAITFLLYNLFNGFKSLFRFNQVITEPTKKSSALNRLFSAVNYSVVASYIVSIFLIMFGVLNVPVV